MKYKYLFFDLDGTLTEPGIGITNSVMYALEKFGIKVNDRMELYKFIGPPLVDSFKEFYGFDDLKAWKAVEYYREYFSRDGLFENRVYDGIDELLQCIEEILRNKKIFMTKTFSYDKAGEIQRIRKYGELLKEEYREDGIYVEAYVPIEIMPV